MKVFWSRAAERELDAISEYVSRQNPLAALRLVQHIRAQVRQLSDLPEIGRIGRVEGTRELVVTSTSYIVPYRIRENQIEVLSVIHGARRWPERFD